MPLPLSRRHFLRGLGGLGAIVLAGCPKPPATVPRDGRGRPVPTPAIDDGDDDMPPSRMVCAATADNIEGPYYKPGAPHRATLVAAKDPGERLALGGTIVGADCQPIAAELDLWHADAAGGYDMAGCKFRATLAVGADGQWHVDTIVPGRYLNGDRYRPAHIHAKLRAPGHRELTTQLYFAGDPYNDGDHWIVPSLIMPTTVADGVRRARFDFVLETA
jgi:protocatechuate 3,4-dioxygenase beta subunit